MHTLTFTAISLGATFEHKLVGSSAEATLYSDHKGSPSLDFVANVASALQNPNLSSFQLAFRTPTMAAVCLTSLSGQAVEVSYLDAMSGYAEIAQSAEIRITPGISALEFKVEISGDWE